ncbi:conserved hypothetical protein [Paraburkholderia ribeironis]|uniref:HNH nuclease domain-containing protein n=1 Tax=Paraburkholderia ribeironis TaxID=1247936 RepID=A0A1N7RNA1_9BURK|nr:HNH endonuclease signature motif containing protein [Paraburkholderia ribeironis]SIT36575.1 conserved hypothetical protein [Paraburkholderia ribeironis]
MAQPISQFFSRLGLPLRNVRWSWGAGNGSTILLRTWADDYSSKTRKVLVLREPAARDESESFGLDERIVHLRTLWDGDVAGYTVIATATDKDARPRHIADYRDDAVFAIRRLEMISDGSIAAALDELVPVTRLTAHAQSYRTQPAEGPFPIDDSQRSGLSTNTYLQKIPAVRAWLEEISRSRGTVTYSEVMNRFGLTFYPLRNAMSKLGHECIDSGVPVITSLIVNETGRCSDGLFAEFGIDDDEKERQRCYTYWTGETTPPIPAGASDTARPLASDEDLAIRAARFARVPVRPEQRTFRESVFYAYAGRCAISGCSVPEALEAAHLAGRDWRQGHNSASDGILLRRDLHALYDRGLLRISDDGKVELDTDLFAHYGSFDGVTIVNWRDKSV